MAINKIIKLPTILHMARREYRNLKLKVKEG